MIDIEKEHISMLQQKIFHLKGMIIEKVKNHNEVFGSIENSHPICENSFQAIRHIGDLENELKNAMDNLKFFTKLYEPPFNSDNLMG